MNGWSECFDGEVKLKEIVAEAGVVKGSFPNLETLVIGEEGQCYWKH